MNSSIPVKSGGTIELCVRKDGDIDMYAGRELGPPIHDDVIQPTREELGHLRNVIDGIIGYPRSEVLWFMTFMERKLAQRGGVVDRPIASRAAKSDMHIANTVRKFVRGAGDIRRVAIGRVGATETDRGLQRRAKESRLAAARRVAEAVQRGVHDQPLMVDAEASRTGQAIRAVANRGVSFLQTRIPKPLMQPESPLFSRLEPAPSEVDKFARYVEAVRDPLSVIDRMANGTLMQAAATKELMGTEKISYAKRVSLGRMLEVETIIRRDKSPSAVRHVAARGAVRVYRGGVVCPEALVATVYAWSSS